MIDSDIIWHQATVTRERRSQQNGHRSAVLWFTGLSVRCWKVNTCTFGRGKVVSIRM